MSKITKRWLSEDLQNQLTGMVSNIIDLEACCTGAKNSIAGLTGAVSNIEEDIAGLTGAIYHIENDIAGITGAISYLEASCTGANSNIAGLTGAVDSLATYIYNLQAIDVGFSPITGAGSTNVQGAIESLVQYVNDAVTGVNYGSGVTGQQGVTGTGQQGVTGYGGVITHSQLTNMPDSLGEVTDHDMRLVPKVQNNAPAIPQPFTGMLWLDMDAPESMGVTGPRGMVGETGALGVTGLAGATGSQGVTGLNPQETSNIVFGSLTISSNTITLDLAQNSTFSVVLTSNVTTVSISNIVSGKLNFFTLYVEQDGAGGKLFTNPVTWIYPSGTAYTVSSSANAKDLIQGMTFNDGTSWLITYAKAFS